MDTDLTSRAMGYGDGDPVVVFGLAGRHRLQTDRALSRLIVAAFRSGARAIDEVVAKVRLNGGHGDNGRLRDLARAARRSLGIPSPSPIPSRWRRARLSPFLVLGDLPSSARWHIVTALVAPTWESLDRAESAIGTDLLSSATASFDGRSAWVWSHQDTLLFRIPLNVSELIKSAEYAQKSGDLPRASHEPVASPTIPADLHAPTSVERPARYY